MDSTPNSIIDDDDVSTPHVGDIELLTSPLLSSSSSSSEAIKQQQQQQQQQQQHNQSTLPTLPADIDEEASPNADIESSAMMTMMSTPSKKIDSTQSPPFSPSTPPPPPPPNNNDNNAAAAEASSASASSSPSKNNSINNKMSIAQLLEVENELRKQEPSSSSATNENEQIDLMDEGGVEEQSSQQQGEAEETESQQGSSCQDSNNMMMEISESDTETEDYQHQNDEQQQSNNNEEEEEEEWEDFMASYWQQQSSKSPSTIPMNSSSNIIISPRQIKLILKQDTDLKPCAMEPELDYEVALSPIRRGCMDIDMDDDCYNGEIMMSEIDLNNNSHDNNDGGTTMNCLSEVGLQCSIAMAEGKSKNGNDTMDGFRIEMSKVVDVGRGATSKKMKGNNILGNQNALAEPVSLTASTLSAAVRSSKSTPQVDDAFNDGYQPNAADQGINLVIPNAPSFASANTDMDDKKSTRSSTAASDTNTGGVGGTSVKSSSTTSDWTHKTSPIPNAELIHLTGPIMTRTSLRSLIMKKWHPSYWMQYGPHKLLIFRSKDHMDDWRYNPYHGRKQRDFLVKLEIDFLADMGCGADGKDIKQDHQHGGGKEQGVLGHRILPVKKKSYGKNEDELYQFKLERWTNLGCSVLAAFASPEEDLTLLLHEAIGAMLKSCPHNGLRNIDHMLK